MKSNTREGKGEEAGLRKEVSDKVSANPLGIFRANIVQWRGPMFWPGFCKVEAAEGTNTGNCQQVPS